MFEIKLDDNNNIKKDIHSIKSNKNSERKNGIVMGILFVYTLISFIIANRFGIFWPLENVYIVCFAGLIYNSIDSLISYVKGERSYKKIRKLAEHLDKTNIKTTADEISNSVIIEKSKKLDKEIQDDKVTKKEREVTKDTYILFLDNDSNIQGLLEKDTTTYTQKDKIKNRQYYILEQEDIEQLEDRVTKVKKLVKTKKR